MTPNLKLEEPMADVEVGQVCDLRDEIIAATPALAHRNRRGHVIRIVGRGADQFIQLADTDGRPLPGWFRRPEVIPIGSVHLAGRTAWDRVPQIVMRANEKGKTKGVT